MLKFLGLKCVKEIIGLLTTGSVGRGNERSQTDGCVVEEVRIYYA